MSSKTSSASASAWDGLEAFYGDKDGMVYIKFRNGENPNNENILFAPASVGAFHLDAKSFIVIKGLTIRNAWSAVLMTNSSNDNIIDGNTLIGGSRTVLVTQHSSRNHIRNNDIPWVP